MKRFFLRALAFVALLGAANAAQLDLTEQENGKDIILRKGDLLHVRLNANPSTGYTWQLGLSKPGLLKAPSGGIYPKVPSGNAVGVPTTVVWKLKALKPGSLTITFSYLRPWEKNIPPVRVVSWPVTIRR